MYNETIRELIKLGYSELLYVESVKEKGKTYVVSNLVGTKTVVTREQIQYKVQQGITIVGVTKFGNTICIQEVVVQDIDTSGKGYPENYFDKMLAKYLMSFGYIKEFDLKIEKVGTLIRLYHRNHVVSQTTLRFKMTEFDRKVKEAKYASYDISDDLTGFHSKDLTLFNQVESIVFGYEDVTLRPLGLCVVMLSYTSKNPCGCFVYSQYRLEKNKTYCADWAING